MLVDYHRPPDDACPYSQINPVHHTTSFALRASQAARLASAAGIKALNSPLRVGCGFGGRNARADISVRLQQGVLCLRPET